MKRGDKVIGQKMMTFESVTSTNDFLKQNKANLNHGTVVSSKIQTRGRGRKNQTWQSELGNLYFSFLLTEGVAYKDLARILFQTSVAIVKVLEEYGVKANIKYPNDIIVQHRKIAGILIETSGVHSLDFVMVGVGINVLQKNIPGLEHKATALVNETNQSLEVMEVLRRFVDTYNLLETETLSYIHGCYIKYSLVIGKTIQINGQEARIKDVTRSGHLVVEIAGEDHIFEDKEISLEDLYDDSL